MNAREADTNRSHKKHRKVLYSLVVVLLILQAASFTMLSLQIVRIERDLTSSFEAQLEESNMKNQQSINEITRLLAQQKENQDSFEAEISLLKSGQGDFSAVIEEAVKGVVGVSTDVSLGSGVLVTDKGYVVTNYHVIDDSNEINVITYDRGIFVAEFIGADLKRDLALLKIDGDHDFLQIGDSDSLQVGNKVIAIGNPLGLSFSVSEGIISGLDRKGPNGLTEYIQTDVSLNPGNSGGPLINTNGEVVGINNFKISNTEGLGFALESNAIKTSVNKIANKTIVD